MDIGLEIKRAREQKGLSQAELADLCGWDGQARISHLETGRTKLNFQDMVTLEDALGISRGTLYARCRGSVLPSEEEVDALFDRVSPDQVTALITKLLDNVDLRPDQRLAIVKQGLKGLPDNPV